MTCESIKCFVVASLFIHQIGIRSALGQNVPTNGTSRIAPFSNSLAAINFTTQRYQSEASRLILDEANRVAFELKLDETLPIRPEDVTGGFVSPYGFAVREGELGRLSAKNYSYCVGKSNKFSDLDILDSVRICNQYRHNSVLPIRKLDTNAALQLANFFLKVISADVKQLGRDCSIDVQISHYWNDMATNEATNKVNFVPIYDIFWTSPENRVFGGDQAYVQVFLPTKRILGLHIHDSKYILRKGLVFTNLDELLH